MDGSSLKSDHDWRVLKNLSHLSVGAKLAVTTIVVTICVIAISIFVINYQLQATAAKEAESSAREAASRITTSVQSIFDNAFDVVSQTHDSLIAMKQQEITDPKVYDVLLRRIIDSGPDRYGAWYILNTNDILPGLSSSTGSEFSTYWHQNGMEILRDSVPDEVLGSALYRIPMTTGHSYLLEPHAIDAVASDSTLVTSFSKPITYNEKVIGVLAIDLKLGAINDALASISLPPGASFTITSDKGLIAMSTRSELIGSALQDKAPDLAPRLQAARGGDGNDLVTDPETGQVALHSHSAIRFDGVETPWYLLLDVPEQSLFASVMKSKITLLVVPLTGFLMILGVVLLTVHKVISQPIRTLAGIIGGLGDGLFDFSIPGLSRTDDVGRMARAVERLQASGIEIAQLHEARGEAEFQREVDRRLELAAISSRFSCSIETLVATLDEVSAKVAKNSHDMSASSQTALSTIAGVSDTSSTARLSLESVVAATNAMLTTIGSIGEQTRQSEIVWELLKSGTISTDRSVSDLKITVEQINVIANDIRLIADQINMIALNATIEAAHAGESGRSFAVVAQEIKILAAQTAKATENIGHHIVNVHRASSDADAQVGDMIAAFSDLRAISQTIGKNLDLQTGMTDEIRRLINDATQGANSLEQDIKSLGAQAYSVHERAGAMLDQGQLLGEETHLLKKEVVQFLAFLKAS